MHAYRTHNCGELRDSRCRRDGPAVGLGPPQARPRQSAVRRPARPFRHHPDRHRRRRRAPFKTLEGVARRIGGDGRRQGRRAAAPRRSIRTCRPAQIEIHRRRGDGPVGGAGAAAAGVRRAGLSRGDPAPLPLSRPPPRAAPRQHRAAQPGDQLDPPADDRAGLHRVPDADPDRVQPGRRARLSGAEPRPSRQVLRAAAGAADVQAADHGRRLRPLFPDRALLPRRGRPRRPLARANSTSSISK